MVKALVGDVMTRNPVTASPTDDLLACAKKMVGKGVGSLLLVENGRLVGFVDESDILWAVVKKSAADLSKINAIDISPRKLATIRPEQNIQDAIQKMKVLKFERLPVIGKGGKLEGMITVRDILNFHPEFYPELEEFAAIREEEEKLKRFKNKTNSIYEEGICEECGERDLLYNVNGLLICESCKISIEA